MPFRNYLGIDAPRSNTSLEAKNLSRYLTLCMPPLKEVHYFDKGSTGPRLVPR